MKRSSTLGLLVALFSGLLSLQSAGAEDLPKPNVLFIAIDDLRPELGCYGDSMVKSPNIDRLAKSGILFNRAYCQQAVCLPSRASLLTGARPDSTKAWDLSTDFRKALPDIVTLPQLFKDNGYVTQAMGKIYHHGYDDKSSWSTPTVFPEASHSVGNRHLHPDWPPIKLSKKGRGPAAEAIEGPDNCLHDGQLGDMAVATLKNLETKDEPFFLAVGFIRPHLPFNAPKKYWELYDRDRIPLAPNPFRPKDAPEFAFPGGNETHSYAGTPSEQHYPDDHARFLKHGYYAAISFVDAQVGRLLDELDILGLSENTIVVLWGDHGWKLGEHDAWAKHTNFENDTRCPLIISAPKMANPGAKCDALVELVDVFPTIADIAGLALPTHLEGISAKPLFDTPDRPWKSAAFSQYPRKVGKLDLMGYTMRTDRYRYTKWLHRKDRSIVQDVELYDHQEDPQENVNRAHDPSFGSTIDALDAQWNAGWQGAAPQTAVEEVESASSEKTDEVSTEPEPLSLDFWKMEFEREYPLAPTLANVPYGDDPQQMLDFWKAESDDPTPLVFFIHGGAWRANDKDRVSGLHDYLADGISVVSINYRFVQRAEAAGIEPPVKWPLEDAARALQFVRSKAGDWNLDKIKIGASGGSAGACSSLWLAFHDDMADPDNADPIARESTRLYCAGTVGAQTSLDPKQMREWTPNIVYGGQPFGFHGDRAKKLSAFQDFLNHREDIMPWIKAYSPFEWVSSDDPPVLLFYSDVPAVGQNRKNATHSANFGVKLQEKMEAIGLTCHLVYPGAPPTPYPDPVAFMIATLKPKVAENLERHLGSLSRRENFQVAGRPAFVIEPEESSIRSGPMPWVLYAPTLGANLPGEMEEWIFDRFHAAGISIAGIDVGESYGSPDGRALFQALYDELTTKRGYDKKPVLLARSRGGLMLYNWAVEHPDSVRGIAGIYPVCNLMSYPGLEKAAPAYGLTADKLQTKLAQHNPIERLEPLANAGVPILHIHGDVDELVPLEANSGELARRYRSLGGNMEIIIAEGQGHNLWTGFFQCQQLVDFVLKSYGR